MGVLSVNGVAMDLTGQSMTCRGRGEGVRRLDDEGIEMHSPTLTKFSRQRNYRLNTPLEEFSKPVRPSAWDCQPPPKSAHQTKPKTNPPPGPVFGTRSMAFTNQKMPAKRGSS